MSGEIPSTRRASPLSDDWSYLLPMALFVGFTSISGKWPQLIPQVYISKTILTAIALFICWPAFTKIDWSAWPLGILVGIVGIVQWIGTEKFLLHVWPHYPRIQADPFDPFAQIPNPIARTIFFIFRWLGPTLVVPFMEEFFWRDYLWRTVIAPIDFKLARIGEWDAKAFWIVPLLFATVHIQWITAIIWALMIGLLLLRTKSLGACIIAHGLTNFLLGAYVLYTHEWFFW